jgi:hypothetical protein
MKTNHRNRNLETIAKKGLITNNAITTLYCNQKLFRIERCLDGHKKMWF